MPNVRTPAGAGKVEVTVKVNVVVPLLPSFADTSSMLSTGPFTLSVAEVLFAVVVPSFEDAVMCAVPGLLAPTFPVATPVVGLVDVESIVATVVLSDGNVIVAPVIRRPY